MKRSKPITTIAIAGVAALLMGLAGCVTGGGYGYDGGGQVVVVGGYDRGHDRNYHPQAPHVEAAHRTAAAASDRGKVAEKPAAAGGERASTDDRK
jgi:hypothetical protein